MAPLRTATQGWLSLFAISPIHYTFQWSRSYATLASKRDYVGVSEAAGRLVRAECHKPVFSQYYVQVQAVTHGSLIF